MTRLPYAHRWTAGFALAAMLAGLSAGPALAAGKTATGNPPAASKSLSAKDEQPSVGTSSIGTTIVGDKESPIGLYITPWKNAYAEKGLDRPARLLDEAPQPIDPGTFRRQIEYYQTISDFRRAQLQSEGGH